MHQHIVVAFAHRFYCPSCGRQLTTSEVSEPAGANHVDGYTIKTQSHDYDLACACPACYARTQNLIKNYWTAEPSVQQFTRKRLRGKRNGRH